MPSGRGRKPEESRDCTEHVSVALREAKAV